jgi:hypothetical protein
MRLRERGQALYETDLHPDGHIFPHRRVTRELIQRNRYAIGGLHGEALRVP